MTLCTLALYLVGVQAVQSSPWQLDVHRVLEQFSVSMQLCLKMRTDQGDSSLALCGPVAREASGHRKLLAFAVCANYFNYVILY